MPKRKSDSPSDGGTETFEACLAKLEEIVESMEHGDLPLEELVRQYEQGSVLLGQCDRFLRSARKRIELITLNAAHEDSVEPADHESTSEDTNDDEIRLF